MSGVDDLTKDECLYLLKEVLVESGWEKRADGLWDMPDRKSIFSSSDSPLPLNDAIHINNAIIKLFIPSE